jgi:hypothetical protein
MAMMHQGRIIAMSDHSAQQALPMPMIEVHSAGAQKLWPREFLTLGLVGTCLSFWAIVILIITHSA